MVNYDHLYDKNYFSEQLEVNSFVEKELSYQSYENAYIVPIRENLSGVYTEEKQYIPHSASFGMGVPFPNSKMEGTIPFIDETVVFLGLWNFYPLSWGHVICDAIKRFWFLETDAYLQEFKECRIVLVNRLKEDGVPENACKVFEILNLDGTKLIDVAEAIQCRRVIIPDECFFIREQGGYRFFTKEYRTLIYKLREFGQEHFVRKPEYEKIYFSYRTVAKYKGNTSEKKLEDFFAEQGYQIIYPEQYTLDEQLNMLANCHFFASTIGSCAHNMIFLPEHANVILIPRGAYLTMYQTAFDQVIDLDIHYVDASLSVLSDRTRPQFGPFFYYISENLMRLFEIDRPCDKKYWREQFSDFKKYMEFAKTCDNLSNRYIPEYYSEQLAYCMEHVRDAHPFRKLYWRMRQLGVKGTITHGMAVIKWAFVRGMHKS